MIDELIWEKSMTFFYSMWKHSKKFIKYFIQYEKTIFTTHLKDWSYLNIIVAGVTLLSGLFAFVALFALAFETGFFWTITLFLSVLLFRWANNQNGFKTANLDDEDRTLLKAVSGIFFVISLMIFLVSIT